MTASDKNDRCALLSREELKEFDSISRIAMDDLGFAAGSRNGPTRYQTFSAESVLRVLKYMLTKLDSRQRNEFLTLLGEPDLPAEPVYNSTRETLSTQPSPHLSERSERRQPAPQSTSQSIPLSTPSSTTSQPLSDTPSNSSQLASEKSALDSSLISSPSELSEGEELTVPGVITFSEMRDFVAKLNRFPIGRKWLIFGHEISIEKLSAARLGVHVWGKDYEFRVNHGWALEADKRLMWRGDWAQEDQLIHSAFAFLSQELNRHA